MRCRKKNHAYTWKILSVILALLMLPFHYCDSNVKAANKKGSELSAGLNVEYHSKEDIMNYVYNSEARVEDELLYSETPSVIAPYKAGKLSDATLNSALEIFNQIRYIAGLDYHVQLKEEYCELTQAGALVNYVNNVLSHFPVQPEDMENALYEQGKERCSSSNLAYASWSDRTMGSAILDWMDDSDPYNIDRVGHRRWMLNPSMGYTGFGAVTRSRGTYSAIYTFDESNLSAREYGVAWPAQNTPIEYFQTQSAWSVSTGKEENISNINVTLTRKSDQKTWHFSEQESDGDFYVDNTGYGQQGCVIFRPVNVNKSFYTDGSSYDVTIEGLVDGTVSYTVNFFSLYGESTDVDDDNDDLPSGECRHLDYSIRDDWSDDFSKCTITAICNDCNKTEIIKVTPIVTEVEGSVRRFRLEFDLWGEPQVLTTKIDLNDIPGYNNPEFTQSKTQNISISSQKFTVSYKKLKKKNKKLTLKISAGKKYQCKKLSGPSGIKVNTKGVVTIKKGMKKGTYTFKICVSANNTGYKASKKNFTIKVVVK